MLATGDIIDQKYRILRKIGQGGMGAVFEAEAMRIHRRVAIKVLRTSFENGDELAQRFQLEAQAAGRIGSRHIVEVFDLGSVDALGHFMVMEYLDGESLRSRIARAAPLAPSAIHAIAEQLLEGVVAAHGAGIVHRDLKPDNVFLVRQPNGADFVKLLDFGISKFASSSGTGSGMALTRTGALLGTPYYLSPEQANGSKVVDHRADIYALGVILYECLTGEVPFQGDTFNELLFKIVLEPAKPFPRAIQEASPEFCALIERAMAKDPNRRFSTAAEMKAALEVWKERAWGLPAFSGVSLSKTEAAHVAPPIPDGPHTVETWANSGDYPRLGSETLAPRRHAGRWRLGLGLAVGVSALAGVFALRPLMRGSGDGKLQAASAAAPGASLAQLPSVASRPSEMPRARERSPAPKVLTVQPSPTASVQPELAKLGRAPLAPFKAKKRVERPDPPEVSSPRPALQAPASSAASAPAPDVSDSTVVRTPGGRAIRGDL